MPYEEAYRVQCEHHQAVLDARHSSEAELGRILMVEHPPVITVTRRPDAASHVTASESLLAQNGVSLHETDRGGDVTYHGPGQLVCYPIVDLNAAKLRIHDYIRVLEHSVMDTLSEYGIKSSVDSEATGVWIDPAMNTRFPRIAEYHTQPAKICAIGVRVRKWITLHGLSVNIDPNMDHFKLLVPCGLPRPVISLKQVLGDECPTMQVFADQLTGHLTKRLNPESRIDDSKTKSETITPTNGYTPS